MTKDRRSRPGIVGGSCHLATRSEAGSNKIIVNPAIGGANQRYVRARPIERARACDFGSTSARCTVRWLAPKANARAEVNHAAPSYGTHAQSERRDRHRPASPRRAFAPRRATPAVAPVNTSSLRCVTRGGMRRSPACRRRAALRPHPGAVFVRGRLAGTWPRDDRVRRAPRPPRR